MYFNNLQGEDKGSYTQKLGQFTSKLQSFVFLFFFHVSVSSVSGLKQNLTNQLSSAFSCLFFFYTASAVLAGVKCHALQMSALAWAPLSSHDGRTCFCVGGLFCQAKLFWSLFFFSCFFFSKSCCCFTKCCLVTGQIRKDMPRRTFVGSQSSTLT